jgi:hypothetical protein
MTSKEVDGMPEGVIVSELILNLNELEGLIHES